MSLKSYLYTFLYCIFMASLSAGHIITITPETDRPRKISLNPGDQFIFKPGTYKDVILKIKGGGNEEQRAFVKAEVPGSVRLIGETLFHVKASYVTLSGFSFDGRPDDFDGSAGLQIEGKDTGPLHDERALGGPARKSGAIIIGKNTYRVRITNCFFSNFDYNYPHSSQGINYMTIYGFEHEIDHNHFEHKRSKNAIIFIKPDPKTEPGPQVERKHHIHHNYFGQRNYIAANGWEVIRISDSRKQTYELACLIEKNYFYKAIDNPGSLAKEREILSNKSRKNQYIGNVFDSCDGQITLRHGRDCWVEDNWFLGKGRSGSSGIRIIGTGHVVKNNKFIDINGHGYAAALTIMQGGYGIVNNQYEGAENITIADNIFVHCQQPINWGLSNNRGKTYADPPRYLTVTGNKILSNETDYPMFTIHVHRDESDLWEGNEFYNTESQDHYGDIPEKSWTKNEALEINPGQPSLKRSDTGVSYDPKASG